MSSAGCFRYKAFPSRNPWALSRTTACLLWPLPQVPKQARDARHGRGSAHGVYRRTGQKPFGTDQWSDGRTDFCPAS